MWASHEEEKEEGVGVMGVSFCGSSMMMVWLLLTTSKLFPVPSRNESKLVEKRMDGEVIRAEGYFTHFCLIFSFLLPLPLPPRSYYMFQFEPILLPHNWTWSQDTFRDWIHRAMYSTPFPFPHQIKCNIAIRSSLFLALSLLLQPWASHRFTLTCLTRSHSWGIEKILSVTVCNLALK